MAILTNKIPDWKTEQINDTAERMKKAHTIAIVDLKGLPAKQFHRLRTKLRSKMDIIVRKKVIIKFALDKMMSEKKNIDQLKKDLHIFYQEWLKVKAAYENH